MARTERVGRLGKRLIDLTPAAIGPFVVPAVNLRAYGLGVRSVRIATHCTEADVSAQHIATAREIGMDVAGLRDQQGQRESTHSLTVTTSAWLGRTAVRRIAGTARD